MSAVAGEPFNLQKLRRGDWTILAVWAVEDDFTTDCPKAFLSDRIGFSYSLLNPEC